MTTNLVLTPGGYRPRSLVHTVEEGHGLRAAGGVVRTVDASKNVTLDLLGVTLQPENVPALGSGWIAYAYWNNGTGRSILSFRTTWTVPQSPTTQSGQTIFLFNGIQNYGANFGILQPVLQWGPSAAGGGPFWSVASWYVTSGGQAFHTQLAQVNEGDTLVGVMALTGQTGSSFSYVSEFEGMTNTRLPVDNIAELLWCNETLEAYNVSQCSDYPASNMTAFSSVDIQTSSKTTPVNWTPMNAITDCGQHAVVVSNTNPGGEVDLYYR